MPDLYFDIFDNTLVLDITETTSSEAVVESFLRTDPDEVHNVILDFSNVEHLRSEQLGWLISVNNEVRKRGGKMFLCSMPPQIYEVFRLTSLDKLFQVFTNRDLALSSLEHEQPAQHEVPGFSSDVFPDGDRTFGMPDALDDWEWFFEQLADGKLKNITEPFVAIHKRKVIGSGSVASTLRWEVSEKLRIPLDQITIAYLENDHNDISYR